MTVPRLLRFANAQEFRARPSFVDQLNPANHVLDAILGGYSFPTPEHLACGLSSCRTKHGRGFLVKTADSLETNIGRDCGRLHFGARWEHLERTFQRQQMAELRQDRVQALLTDRQALMERAQSLVQPLGEAEKAVATVLREIGKESTLNGALQRALRDGGTIAYDRQLTAEQRALSGNQNQRFVVEIVGRLSGTSAVAAKRLSSRLRYEVLQPLAALTVEDVAHLKDKALEAKARWVTELRLLLDGIPTFIEEAERFSSEANWRRFSLLFLPGRASTTNRGRRILARLSGETVEAFDEAPHGP